MLVGVPEGALELVGVDELHEQLEVGLLSVVGRRGKQQQVRRGGTHQLGELVALRPLGTVGPHGGRKLVRLVKHNKIPGGMGKLLLQLIGTRELVETRYAEVLFSKRVACRTRLEYLVGHNLECQAKLLQKLVLPLFHKRARAYHEAATQVATCKHLLDKQAGHNGLARARVISQNIAQRHPGKHLLVDSAYLVGQGLDLRRRHRQIGVEEVRLGNTVCLRREFEQIGFGGKRPLWALTYLDTCKVVPVQHKRIQGASCLPERDACGDGAEWLHSNDFNRHARRPQTANPQADSQVFYLESSHAFSPVSPQRSRALCFSGPRRWRRPEGVGERRHRAGRP